MVNGKGYIRNIFSVNIECDREVRKLANDTFV